MSAQWEVTFRIKKDNKRADLCSKVQGLLSTSKELIVLPNSLKIINRSTGGARSKGIGSDFERKIVKILSDWWGLPLRRTPNSGGWDKQVQDGVLQAPGDIIAPYGTNFPFCIECKHRRSPLNLFSLQHDSSDCAFDWWKQCTGDATASKKIPLLIASCARTEYAIFDDIECGQFVNFTPGVPVQLEVFVNGKHFFSVMHLEDFLVRYGRKDDGSTKTA